MALCRGWCHFRVQVKCHLKQYTLGRIPSAQSNPHSRWRVFLSIKVQCTVPFHIPVEWRHTSDGLTSCCVGGCRFELVSSQVSLCFHYHLPIDSNDRCVTCLGEVARDAVFVVRFLAGLLISCVNFGKNLIVSSTTMFFTYFPRKYTETSEKISNIFTFAPR